MKFERKQTITFKWWSDEAIPEQFLGLMDEHAIERANAMLKEGYICGELSIDLVCGAHEPMTTTYKGWWELTTEITEGGD